MDPVRKPLTEQFVASDQQFVSNGVGTNPKLIDGAKAVLAKNDVGRWTIPAAGLYPHQWLWDSCFVAIGLRHYNPQRAATELRSLLRGQWQNGMLPHIIINTAVDHWADETFWRSQQSEGAPANQPTSGMTQPPLPAIAVLAVSDKLPPAEARVFLKEMYPHLLAYHTWIYSERVPANNGLAVLIHPWETGLDNSPGWQQLMKKFSPLWITAYLRLNLGKLFERFRRDTKLIPPEQRLTNEEAVKLLGLSLYARKHRYNSKKLINRSRFTVESLIFNALLIAANKALQSIAAKIAEDLPADLSYRFSQTERGLDELWDEESGTYRPRAHKQQKLLGASATTFLPMYAGCISRERAARLVGLLKDNRQYWPPFPVPSVAINAMAYDEDRYWAGPTWVNMNWLIIQGLLNYGYMAEAAELKQSTIAMVAKSGWHEYFSSRSGSGYGSDCFSWTAALFLDLVSPDTGGLGGSGNNRSTGPSTTAVNQPVHPQA